MEIIEDENNNNENSGIILDSKKQKINKAIEEITNLIDKYTDKIDNDENLVINEIITYISQNNLDCFEILDPSKATLLHCYCSQQKYFHFKIYILTIEKILKNTNRLNEYLLKEDITKKNIFEIASELGDIKIFDILYKYLENNEFILTSLINQEKNNIFHISASEGKIISLLFYYEFYKDNPSVLNSKNRSKWTPLMIACYNQHYEYIQNIIKLGADFSLIEKNGKNALFYAVERNNNRIVKYLILIGIDKNKKDNKNKKAIDYTNDSTTMDLLQNKNLFQTLCKCQIEYKSLKGHKNHIYYLTLLIILIILHTLIISLFNFLDNKDKCVQNFNSINFTSEFIIFIICILFESFGIFYYFYFHCKFAINSNIIGNPNNEIKLYKLYSSDNDICVKCKKRMNNNTQHCIACDKCIDNWDHHCFWLNVCINKKNKKYFNFFMIQLFLIILVNMILSIFLFMDIILYPKIYYAFTNICAEEQNNFDFISILILIIFIVYFISSIYMLYGALMPFLFEFLCGQNNDNEIKFNFSSNERIEFLSGSEE